MVETDETYRDLLTRKLKKLDAERKKCAKNLDDKTKLLTSNLCSKCKIDLLYNVTDHYLLDLRKMFFISLLNYLKF